MIIQVRGTNSKTNTNYHHKPHISNKTNKKNLSIRAFALDVIENYG